MGDLMDALQRATELERAQVDTTRKKMDELQALSVGTLQTMEDACRVLRETEVMVARKSAMELAQEQIILLTQRKQQEFDAHQYVRRVMLGVVRDLDPGMVRQRTIRELSEQLWIQCSEFWLSHALVAVAAWIRNDRTACENAVKACIRTDSGKGSLFFCLMNLRMERNKAADQWLRYYLCHQNPSFMEPESGILIQAYLGGLFGQDPNLQANVDAIVNSWEQELTQDDRTNQMILREYYRYLLFLPVEPRAPFATLGRVSVDATAIERQRDKFGRFSQMAAMIALLKEKEAAEDVDKLRRRSDRILDRLLHEKVPEEREIDARIADYERILKHHGNRERAQAEYIAEQIAAAPGFGETAETDASEEADRDVVNSRVERSYQIGTRMVRWALDEKEGVSPSVRRYAMHHTSSWLIEAAKSFYDNNEREVKRGLPHIRLRIGGWQGMTDGEDLEDLLEDMQQYFEKRRLQILVFNAPNLVALILLLLTLVLTFITPYMLAGSAAALLFLVFQILNGLRGFEPMVETSRQELTDAVHEAAAFYAEAEEEKQQLTILEEEVNEL